MTYTLSLITSVRYRLQYMLDMYVCVVCVYVCACTVPIARATAGDKKLSFYFDIPQNILLIY